MSATLSKLRISWVGRALLAYAVSALALVVLGLAAPGSAVFFPLVSLWCNLALFGLVLVVLRLADVKFDLFHWAVIIGFWAAALLYFYWAETRRSFVYIWDYVNYINKQYNAEAAFLQGPAVGFHFILDSLAEDYTNFNTLFIEFPFCLTDRTGDSFAICQVFSIVPMLLLLLAGLVVKVGQMLQVKNRFWYFLIGLSWTFTYPWLRMSAVLSQPDWFGLIFAFSILLLTLDFRFEKLDLPRFGLLFLATAAIILSRRWYLYFVVGYYFAYAVLVLVSSARIAKVGRKQDALLQVRNLILFGLMSMVAMVILLWPLVSHILGYDYADHYSYYNGGGMVTETYLQCARMGLMNLVLMGMGLWFCLQAQKDARSALSGRAGDPAEHGAVHPGADHRFPTYAAVFTRLVPPVPDRRRSPGRGHEPPPEPEDRLLAVHHRLCHLGALLPPDHRGSAGFSHRPHSSLGFSAGERPRFCRH